jgi:hypothetical protein
MPLLVTLLKPSVTVGRATHGVKDVIGRGLWTRRLLAAAI